MKGLLRAGTLADPHVLADRVAALPAAHMRPLTTLAQGLREQHGAVPFFDPFDGGTRASLLLLLETPGPSTATVRFASRDNPTGTARNLRTFLDDAALPRHETVIWNAVPWVIHRAGARNRAPTAREIRDGIAALPRLLDLLPRLRVVVLAGRVAQSAAATIADLRPALEIHAMPHPSPVLVCTDPAIAALIRATLARAARSAFAQP